MTCVPNAGEFILAFQRVRTEYENLLENHIARTREEYTGTHRRAASDSISEIQVRVSLVNALLASLNWRQDISPRADMPNVISEAAVLSKDRGTTRFLDYLGLERGTINPLLLVETKRPSTPLPEAHTPSSTYSGIVARGLAGEDLKGDWNEWLQDLRDYIHSVHDRTGMTPKRVVITNGDWLILFIDPADAFLENGDKEASRILVFENRDEMESCHYEVFRHLEYQRVLGDAPILTPDSLLSYIQPRDVSQAMYGLHLQYDENLMVRGSRPTIFVAPIIFLRSRFEAWFCVEAPPNIQYEIPHRPEELAGHITEVGQAANELLAIISERLQARPDIVGLSNHNFSALPGVCICGRDEFYVATGDAMHYILPEAVVECPYHDWNRCYDAGVPAGQRPIMARSIFPRSFFTSGELFHCAHSGVAAAKASEPSMDNHSLFASSLRHEDPSFCFVWLFEQYLCCRVCAFLNVCIQSPVFRLPCIQTPHPGDVRQEFPR